MHGFNQINLGQGETVLVIGAGTIGLTAQLAAQSRRCKRDRPRPPSRTSRRPPAAWEQPEVLSENEASRQRLTELTDDDALDVVAECVGGHADTIRQAVDVVARLGRVLVLGLFAIDSAAFNPFTLMLREITMTGSVTYGAPGGRIPDYQQSLDILASYPEQARSLITHRFTLDEVNDSLRHRPGQKLLLNQSPPDSKHLTAVETLPPHRGGRCHEACPSAGRGDRGGSATTVRQRRRNQLRTPPADFAGLPVPPMIRSGLSTN